MRCGADIQLEHPSSSVNVRERDVDTFLESGGQHLRRKREAIRRFRRRRRPICLEEGVDKVSVNEEDQETRRDVGVWEVWEERRITVA